MTVTPQRGPVADQQVFRDVIGRFTSGVTVITTAVDGTRFGTTASAFSSLSLEPPMVLVCLNRTSETQAAVLKAGAFVVNILSEGQQELAHRFARKGDKFGDLEHGTGRHGVPVLHGTLAHLECDTAETVTGGTHTVFLGNVTVAAGHDGTPLTYYRGRFGRLESAREEEATRPSAVTSRRGAARWTGRWSRRRSPSSWASRRPTSPTRWCGWRATTWSAGRRTAASSRRR